MKKLILICTILLISAMIISGCSEDSEQSNANEKPTNNDSQEETNDDNDPKSDSKEEIEDSSTDDEDNSNSSNDSFKVQTEDQLDLGIDDTGKFDTSIGTYEITLDSAKIIEGKLDGESSQLDNLLLLDLTVKNTSNDTQQVEDLLEALEITHNLEGTGSSDAADYFDSVEKMTGEIASGEEISGQFIADISEKDKYYFRKKVGNIAAGTSNQVVWNISAEEAK